MSVFKTKATPATNTNATRETPRQPAGKQIVHSRNTGDPLPTTGVAPHDPPLPWPPAVAVDHKPMKLKGE